MVKLTEKVVLGRARSHSLETVKNLNCWGSRLTDISVISKMENVEVINASTNYIESLKAFSYCSSLRELYLRRNAIKSLNEVLHLRNLPDLRVLWLSGNPCCKEVSEDAYRLTVIKALPSLTKLDNVVITQDEFRKARIAGEDLSPPDALSDPAKETGDIINHSSDGVHVIGAIPEKKDSINEKVNDESQEKSTANDADDQTIKGSVVDETNELRKQLGFKPLPLSASHSTITTMGQTTTSIHVLTASLALIRDMDESALITLQDAIRDRLSTLQHENNSQTELSVNCNLSVGSSPDRGSTKEIV